MSETTEKMPLRQLLDELAPIKRGRASVKQLFRDAGLAGNYFNISRWETNEAMPPQCAKAFANHVERRGDLTEEDKDRYILQFRLWGVGF